VVFVCRNNQWAISLPRSAQTRAPTIAQRAIAYGMPGIQVDGNDVLAVYAATREALERARAGGGPTLIEAITYRLMQHTTSDDPTRYRGDTEVQDWWKRDPIPRFRQYLEKSGHWSEAEEEKLQAEVKLEVDAAVAEFEARTDLKPDAAFDFVFETEPPMVAEQRAEFLRNLEEDGHHG
jgi:TPP-dependent pyruvate/acetoin dehydrogenase alpha subunit